MQHHRLSVAIAVAVLGFFHAGAVAQTADGSARLRLQLNQANAENARLIRENTELSAEVDRLTKALDAKDSEVKKISANLNRVETTASRYRRSTEQSGEALGRLREQQAELVAQCRKIALDLRQTEQDRSQLDRELSDNQTALRSCAANNASMFATAEQALDALEGRGAASKLAEREPFTQLARVRLENMVDEFRYALEDNRIDPPDAGEQDAAPVDVEGSVSGSR